MSRARVVAVAVVICIAAAGPASARLTSADGARWPGRRITYFDATRHWRWSVGRATAEWNASGVRTRFVRVFDRRRADVIVVERGFPGPVAGRGSLGWSPYYQSYVELDVPRYFGHDRFAMAWVAAHELGHVLGLGHSSRPCTLMHGGSRRCRVWNTPSGMWRCRLLQREDVGRAVRKYGGTVRPLRSPVNCYRYPLPPPPGDVEAAVVRDGTGVRLSWVNPSGPGASQILVKRKASSCATSPEDPDAAVVARLTRSAGELHRRGARQALVDVPRAYGTYCYSVWSGDESGPGRLRRPAATVYVTLEPPPRPANDDFSAAIAVEGWPFTSEISATHATLEEGEPHPTCASSSQSSVWYRLAAPSDAAVTVSTAGSGYDTVLAAFEGDALTALTEVACDDDGAGDLHSQVELTVTAGQSLWIQVSAFSDEAGVLTLSIEES